MSVALKVVALLEVITGLAGAFSSTGGLTSGCSETRDDPIASESSVAEAGTFLSSMEDSAFCGVCKDSVRCPWMGSLALSLS
jgi:hypothetical protein